MFLFVNDATVNTLNQTTENIAFDMKEISNWRKANKLEVNISSTFKML